VEYGALPCESAALCGTVGHVDGGFIAVLVRRCSALLQLKSVIGPSCSAELAESQYPRSLSCLLASLSAGGVAGGVATAGGVTAAGGVSAGTSAGASWPLLLPTLTCASANTVIQECFPHFHNNHAAQQAALSLTVRTSDAASAPSEEDETAAVGSGFIAGQPVKVPLAPKFAGMTGAVTPTTATTTGATLGLKTTTSDPLASMDTTSSSTVATTATVAKLKHVDIAGIVVSHALIQEVGLGIILEALFREGLVVSVFRTKQYIFIVWFLVVAPKAFFLLVFHFLYSFVMYFSCASVFCSCAMCTRPISRLIQ
jgi:hypothetical protein